MADAEEDIIPQTLQQKALFYTTAFFILLGTFSLFAFLFLVPFVIDPAFTTIFMQFDTHPAWCVTTESETLVGASNCTWSSCREGCTKELFRCTHVRVNYKLVPPPALPASPAPSASPSPLPTALAMSAAAARREEEAGEEGDNATDDGAGAGWGTSRRAGATPRPTRAATSATTTSTTTTTSTSTTTSPAVRAPRAIREYDYLSEDILKEEEEEEADADNLLEELQLERGLQGNDSEWYYVGAKLYPNVKGCGYPPMLECSVFFDAYGSIGSNFSCYYSKVDPGLVISELDMHQVYMNLVYAMAIPIPSFIVSVIYLTFAYFVIYNEDDEGEEGLVAGTDAGDGEGGDGTGKGDGTSPLPKDLTASDGIASDAFREGLLLSSSPPPFGQGLKVAMADEKSSESVATAASAGGGGATTPAPTPLAPPPPFDAHAHAAPPPVPPSASIPGLGGGEAPNYLQPGYLPPSRGKKILPPIA